MLSYLSTFNFIDLYALFTWLYIVFIGFTDRYQNAAYMKTASVMLISIALYIII